ncbi:MAG: DUF1570 domain-containing protein [Planctomycetia bacterium]
MIGRCPAQTAQSDGMVTEVRIEEEGSPLRVRGRLVAEGSDGALLLEDVDGKYLLISAKAVQERTSTADSFQLVSDEDFGRRLLAEVGEGFEIRETQHFLICSNSSEAYSDFCGRLLEKVFEEYIAMTGDLGLTLRIPDRRLPILIFASASEFQAHASRIHPETPFEDTPGFYTVRDNQVLLSDLTRDRSLRTAAIRKKLAESPLQLATIIHEAVHQLAFNTGLQNRFADNPVWFSEGLALYFEQTSVRSPLLWSKPGTTNARHHPEFVRLAADGTLPIPLTELLTSDQTFQTAQSARAAYAESWALMTFLIRQHPEKMGAYMRRMQSLRPLESVSAEQRIAIFRESFETAPDELQKELIPWIRRQRVPR